jgi:hypothetical protein
VCCAQERGTKQQQNQQPQQQLADVQEGSCVAAAAAAATMCWAGIDVHDDDVRFVWRIATFGAASEETIEQGACQQMRHASAGKCACWQVCLQHCGCGGLFSSDGGVGRLVKGGDD